MAVKKSEESEEKKEAAAAPTFDMKMFEELQKEIKELKEQKQVTPNPGNVDMAKLMTELVEGLKDKPDSEKYGGKNAYVDQSHIDPDDILDKEDEVTFFCYRTRYLIVDDKRQGLPVQTPFKNEIWFKYSSTRQRQVGKEIELLNLSTYACKSKKEKEWLLEHTLYGSMFFTSIDSNSAPDSRKAAKLVKYMTSLMNMGQSDVVSMAKQHGIPMMEKVHEMRLAIANKLADQEVEKELAANEIRIQNTEKAKKLLASEEIQ